MCGGSYGSSTPQEKINGVVKANHLNQTAKLSVIIKKYINCLYCYSPVGNPNVFGHIHVHNIYRLNGLTDRIQAIM